MVNSMELKQASGNLLGCFSEFSKDIIDNSSNLYFLTEGDLICSQDVFQKNSYNFIDSFFKKALYKPEPIKMYITLLDISEIKNGMLDLSNPSLHDQKYSVDVANSIFDSNNNALKSFKNAFSLKVLSEDLTLRINQILDSVKGKDNDDTCESITNFLNAHSVEVSEVILFCKLLNLVCFSQCLYAFCFQITQSSNFVKIMELILTVPDLNNEKYETIFKLANRLNLVYIANMTARVFSEKTLQTVEEAMSSLSTQGT